MTIADLDLEFTLDKNEHPTITLFKVLRKRVAYVRSFVGKGYSDVEGLGKGGNGGRAYNVYPTRGKALEDEGKGWKRQQWDRLILELERYNAAEPKASKAYPYQVGGFCPYVVINNGGHNSNDISDCPALFLEFDEPITKAEALAKIRDFPLQPTLIIESRKGYHVYWRLEKNTTVSLWREFQWRLIEYFESDACIEDPSRVMRLPGFYHLKAGEEPFLVSIKYIESEHQYSIEDFDRVLPPTPKWRLKLDKATGDWGTPQEVKLEDGLGFWDIRDHKQYLKHYVENGRREYDTCQCPVHSKDKRDHSTDSLHIHHDTGKYKCHGGCDPQDIYAEVCRLAGVSKFKVVDASAIDGNAVGNKTDLEKTRQRLESTIRDIPYESVINELQPIIDADITDEIELDIQLMNATSKIFGNSYPSNLNQIREYYNKLLDKTLEGAEENYREELEKQQLAYNATYLDFQRLMQGKPIGQKLMTYAEKCKLPELHMMISFLTITSALLPSDLKLYYTGEHKAIPNLITLLVSESTAGKDRIIDPVYLPLMQLNSLALDKLDAEIEKYEEELEEYYIRKENISDLKKPKKPIEPRKYCIHDANVDSRKDELATLKRYKARLLEYHSEFYGLMKGMSDRHSKNGNQWVEDLLIAIYNALEFTESRKGEKTKKSRGSYAMSIIAGTQYDRIPDIIDLENKSGFASRLIYLTIEGYLDIEDSYFNPFDNDSQSIDSLGDTLKQFYLDMEQYWADYKKEQSEADKGRTIAFSPDAFELMKNWLLTQRKAALETEQKGKREWLRRIRQTVTRICLNWHCTKLALEGMTQDETIQQWISKETALEAIMMTKALIPHADRIFKIKAANSMPASKRELIEKIFEKQKKLGRPITVRDIRGMGEFYNRSKQAHTPTSELHIFLSELATKHNLGTYDKKTGFTPFI